MEQPEHGREEDERRHRAGGDTEREEATETLEAAVARHHQRAESEDRRQRVDEDGVGRRRADPIGAGALQGVVDDVNAVVDGDPEHERNADEVGGIEVDPQQAHESERLPHSHRQRERGEKGMAERAEVEPQHHEDHQERRDRRLLVAPLHLQRRLVRLERVAGGAGIDAANIRHEALERVEVPNVATAVDLEEVLAG